MHTMHSLHLYLHSRAEPLCTCIIVLTQYVIILSGSPRTALTLLVGGLNCESKGKDFMNLAFVVLCVTEYLTMYV